MTQCKMLFRFHKTYIARLGFVWYTHIALPIKEIAMSIQLNHIKFQEQDFFLTVAGVEFIKQTLHWSHLKPTSVEYKHTNIKPALLVVLAFIVSMKYIIHIPSGTWNLSTPFF